MKPRLIQVAGEWRCGLVSRRGQFIYACGATQEAAYMNWKSAKEKILTSGMYWVYFDH